MFILDNETGKIVKTIKDGTFTECANMTGGFTSFEKKNFSVSISACSEKEYCEEAFMPNKAYIKIGNKTFQESHTYSKGNLFCIQQKGDKYSYCWEE